MRTRMSGGVGGGSREVSPYPDSDPLKLLGPTGVFASAALQLRMAAYQNLHDLALDPNSAYLTVPVDIRNSLLIG